MVFLFVFILGGQFSVADILVAHTLSWARSNDIPIESELVNRYADRVLERPALTRALQKEHLFGH